MSKYLKINNLSYAYPDGHKALKGIDFSINKGESIAILGPNGAGKTTLILHLNGILGELKGEIEVDGLEYSSENIGKIRKTVGVVFQDPDDQLFMRQSLKMLCLDQKILDIQMRKAKQML